jgi:hypothetical protein
MADHDPITAIRGQRAYGGLAFCDSQIDTLLSRIDELTAERDYARKDRDLVYECNATLTAELAAANQRAAEVAAQLRLVRPLLVESDSLISAITHGRPMGSRDELINLYSRLRSAADAIARGDQPETPKGEE